MPRGRRYPRRIRAMQGQDALDRALNQKVGPVFEDGSFRTRGGRVYDAESKRYRRRRRRR